MTHYSTQLMTDSQRDLAVAWAIIDKGEFGYEGWYDDGDVESGPRGGRLAGFFCFDLGRVELTQNGSVALWKRDSEMPTIVYNSIGGSPRSAAALAEYLRQADQVQGDPHEQALKAAKARVAAAEADRKRRRREAWDRENGLEPRGPGY